ncbi:inositol monophosphatase and related sulfite synthesis enzyme [Vibrio variabilis]|uniref:Inositol monophosphatase and related sulfite synthesis enzyme n=1 Tax=Vibrio variabilis TaxID=990271 RepID=A0ABQ0J792_9VIBR|nr:inositol monophosphatase and related sulfite synthesis enzyme [Vibrio variabilis]
MTDCDKKVEQDLVEHLKPLFPDFVFMGEEMMSNESTFNPEHHDKLVVIDPIDGTYNFAHGIGVFGVMLAIRINKQTVFSMLYDPINDDWVWAQKGHGCYWQNSDGERRDLVIGEKEGDYGFISPFLFDEDQTKPLMALMQDYKRTISFGCSCHEYRGLLFGAGNFYLTQRKIKPWDHYAGLLAITEAGGYAAYLDGESADTFVTGKNLLVTTSYDKWQYLSRHMQTIL